MGRLVCSWPSRFCTCDWCMGRQLATEINVLEAG